MKVCAMCGWDHSRDKELMCFSNSLYDALQERDRYKGALRKLVDHLCSCGGRGPNDEGVCKACVFWHDTLNPNHSEIPNSSKDRKGQK